jgi:hypothetical protein
VIAAFDPATFSAPEEEQAFLINAYNLLVIYSVVERYPLQSPQDVGGFFNRRKHTVAGESLTLDELEKKRLLQKYRDARFHFALVCAAKGCPRITNDAYREVLLNEQLNRRARETLNDEYYIRLDHQAKKVFLPEIFKWYEKDFIAESKSAIVYINQFRDRQIPEDYSVSYIPYDWALNDVEKETFGNLPLNLQNLQAYTPSTLLKPGEYEIKLFNNVYTQTAFYNDAGDRQDQNGRSTFYTGIINFLYGIKSTFNIGFDFYLKSVRYDLASASPFSVFKFSSGADARTDITQIGPKVKISPFSGLRSLAIQSTLLLPVASDLDGSQGNHPYLDVNGIQWWNQLFYDRPFLNDFLFYFEAGFFFRFDSPFEDFYTPLKAFFNYYPTSRWTLYLPVEFTPYWQDGSWNAYYGQGGLGTKYQFTPNLELELLYTNFLVGKNQGAGETFNLGLRIIR